MAGIKREVMGVADDGGIDVAGFGRVFAADGDRFGGGPLERTIEDEVRVDDATTEHAALAALIIVIADQAGLGVEDEGGGRAHDFADVRLRMFPRHAGVEGGQLVLRAGRGVAAPDFAASDGEDLAVAEVDRRGLGRPLGSAQAGLDRGLLPGGAVIGAGERTPGMIVAFGIAAGEPQAHQADLRHGEDVRDLDGRRRELGCRDQLEVHAVGGAIKVLLPFFADAADPEERRALGVEPLAHGHLAEAGRIGHHGLGRPGAAAIGGSARVGEAGVFVDGVPGAAAVDADQLVADRLHHRPRVIALGVLDDEGLGCGGKRRDLHQGQAGGADEGIGRVFRFALDADAERSPWNDAPIGFEHDGAGDESLGRYGRPDRIPEVTFGGLSVLDHLRKVDAVDVLESRFGGGFVGGHDDFDLHRGAIDRKGDEAGDRLAFGAAGQRPDREVGRAVGHRHQRGLPRRDRELMGRQDDRLMTGGDASGDRGQ